MNGSLICIFARNVESALLNDLKSVINFNLLFVLLWLWIIWFGSYISKSRFIQSFRFGMTNFLSGLVIGIITILHRKENYLNYKYAFKFFWFIGYFGFGWIRRF